MAVHEHPAGEYLYSQGSRFAAHGVVSRPGFNIERGIFDSHRPWEDGFARIARHLDAVGRPISSLVGIELRMPTPLEFDDFKELNTRYLEQLDSWSLLINGESPFCRTNVSPTFNGLTGPALAAFSYTVPDAADLPPGFVLSGAAELPLDAPFPDGVIRRGETNPDAMLEKAAAVADLMDLHLDSLGLKWEPSAQMHLYAAHDVAFATSRHVLTLHGVAPNGGIIWHDAAPPTHEIKLEIDLRRYAAERLIATV